MQTQPILTDPAALARNRARARDPFLHADVIADVQERLGEVNKAFTKPAVITPFADLWQDGLAQGGLPVLRVVAPDDVLDLAPGDHDLVIHALGLHWANDPVGQLVQCRRALAPDGLLLAVLFGGQTLHELRSALAQAEAELTGGLSPRVLPMAEIRDLGGLLQRAGLALPVADSFARRVMYRDLAHLAQDLRDMGEGNALAARLRHPTRRAVFARAEAIYRESFGTGDRIPATFEIITLTGWAPHDSQQKPLRPGSAQTLLANALTAGQPPRHTTGS